MRIETRIAKRLKKINPSLTLSLTAKAKKLKSEGKNIIDFASGEPDFDTPDFIKESAIQAIKEGFTKYTPSSGIAELRSLISEKFKRDNSLDYSPEQIVVSCGAKHSIFNALLALVDPGDEVIIPSPYWLSYPEMVSLCGGKPRIIPTLKENSFKVLASELKGHITSKTKALILNTPSNPCGTVYTKEELWEIGKICVEKKVFIISDEVYEKFIYDATKHVSIGSLDKDIYNFTVTINGVSKSFSMTGWRIGYLGAPLDVVEAIKKIQDHSTSNPTSISQKAAVSALRAENSFFENIRREFQKRRDLLIEGIKSVKNIDFIFPQGAFYLFCNIEKTNMSSLEFCEKLLEEKNVAVIPGKPFGRDDYVRISFATSQDQIKEGIERIRDWLGKKI